MPHDIKTDVNLLRRLTTPMAVSREQLLRQRVSFIYGALPQDSTITRHQIEETLKRGEGVTI